MKEKKVWLQIIPIFLCAFTAWFYTMQYTPLAYIYNTFPGREALVMMVVTAPPLVAMGTSFLSSVMMPIFGRKLWMIICMALTMAGGALAFFLGEKSLMITVVGSALTGVAAGGVPPCCYAILAEVASDDLRDKVIGWNDSACTLGAVFCGAAGGFLANGGAWPRSFAIYFILLPIIALVAVFVPNAKESKTPAPEKAQESAPQEALAKSKIAIPSFVIGLIVIKVISGVFYMGKSLFASDYYINEMAIGDSAVLGSLVSVNTVAGLIGTMLLFLWLRLFKGYISFVMLALTGVGTLMMILFPTNLGIVIGMSLWAIGCNCYHSATGAVISMGAQGQIVGTVASIYMGMSYLGESLAGYALPWFAKLTLGSSTASSSLLVSGIMCIVIGVISIPFFKKGYPIAFPDNKIQK